MMESIPTDRYVPLTASRIKQLGPTTMYRALFKDDREEIMDGRQVSTRWVNGAEIRGIATLPTIPDPAGDTCPCGHRETHIVICKACSCTHGTVTAMETDTILAALRLWQLVLTMEEKNRGEVVKLFQDELEPLIAIAREQTGDMLNMDEIDGLCERLNIDW